MIWTRLNEIFPKLIRTDQPESPQLVVVLSASAALILTLAAVVLSCALRIAQTGDIGMGAVAAFASSVGGLTALAIHSNVTSRKAANAATGAQPGTTNQEGGE